jgi:hypothetical protein
MGQIDRTIQAARAEVVAPPLMFRRQGAAMVALHPGQLDRYYPEGETTALVEYQHRSDKTHKHEFAFLREAWQQLPEQYADEYPNPEALRKKLLIKLGWYHETIIDAGTNAAAMRVAAAMRGRDADFTYIGVRGGFVIISDAKSQSRRAMDRADFQASKQALLDAVSAMIGVEPAALTANAGAAA